MTNQGGNKIRIIDIAAKAGVSSGTVDRVLHNRGEVAEVTREHILEIVEELRYTPNLLAKSLASKKLYKIAALIPDSGKDNPYWEKPRFGIQQAAASIKDFNARVLIQTFDFNSERSFIQAFAALKKEKPQGLIFTPVFYRASHSVIHECEKEKIPYIFVDMKLDACNNLSYFGQNAEQSGFLSAKLLYASLPAGSEVIVIKPLYSAGVGHHLLRREKGFLSFYLSASNRKGITTHSFEININAREDLYNSLDEILNSDLNVQGIFVANSRSYKIAEYLDTHKRKDILLIGYDLIAENLDYLERGIINYLIGQKPEEQGYKSVRAMFNHLLTERSIDKTNYSPIDIIMKENIDYYKNYKF